MSELPEAVRLQAERADAITKELADGQNADTSQETPTEASSEHVEHTDPVDPAQPRDEWKDKYSTLQGKYNHEVPRLHADIRQMREQMQAMNQQLQSKQQEMETPAQADLNPDAFDEYGEEFKQMAQTVQSQKAEIAKLHGAMGEVVQGQNQTKNERFWAEIERLVPDWRERNQNPNFLQWLGESNPGSRESRQTVLESAQHSFDASRVAELMNAWPGKQVSAKKQSSIESQVAPGRSGTNANGNTPSQPTYSRGDIAEFYKLSATSGFPFSFKGKMITSEEEARAVSRDISVASGEGRISY